MPQLCSGYAELSIPLSPDRPQHSASALPGMAILLPRMKQDSSSTVLGDIWLYQAGRGQEEEKFPSCLGSGCGQGSNTLLLACFSRAVS